MYCESDTPAGKIGVSRRTVARFRRGLRLAAELSDELL